MLGEARKGGGGGWAYIPLGEKLGNWVKETRGDIQNFCVGVRDPWRYPEFCVGVRDPEFCVGVRDPWRYTEFLCGCERPMEISRIYVWM